jgi:hypothetical protein
MVGDFSTSELSERSDGNIVKLVAILKGDVRELTT